MVFNTRYHRQGTTLIEIMIVVAIIGILITVVPNLYTQIRRFFFLSNAKVELQREAVSSLELMTRRLRQARSTTMVMDSASGQPVYSRISFTDIDGKTNTYFQSGKNLVFVMNGSTKTISTNLRYLAFALPRSDDLAIVSVSLTLEKSTYQGLTKALHMASEKVRVMN